MKKVIFPLEMLTLVSTGSVLFHSIISFIVLLTAELIFKGYIPFTVVYLPVILLPLLIIGLGLSWFLAALTVYIRDAAQITNVLVTDAAIHFGCYPISPLPEKYQKIIRLNPIAPIVSESRKVLIFGQLPDWILLGGMFLIGLFMAVSGYWWFQKMRKGFADVL